MKRFRQLTLVEAGLFLFLFLVPPACRDGAVERARARPKLLLICVDGAGRSMLDRYRGEGLLPNIQALVEKGALLDLDVEEPLWSPVAWTSILTGKPPSEHGITKFTEFDPVAGKEIPLTSASRRVKSLWNMIDRPGDTVAFLGYWATWPPEPVHGILVSDRTELADGTYPKEIRTVVNESHRALSARFGDDVVRFTRRAREQGIDPAPILDRPRVKPIWEKVVWVYLRDRVLTRVACRVVERERPAIVGLYLRGIDVVSHVTWKHFEPEKFPGVPRDEVVVLGDVVPEIWRMTDELVGDLVKAGSGEYAVLLLSDHGMVASSFEYDVDVDLSKILAALGPGSVLDRSPEPLRAAIRPCSLVSRAHDLQWICLDANTEESRGGFARLAEELRGLKLESGALYTQAPVADLARTPPRIEMSFDVRSIHPDSRIVVAGVSHPATDFFRFSENSGGHRPEAVLLASGAPFSAGAGTRKASAYDVVPTALYLLGYPIALDFKGKVVEALFPEKFLSAHPVETVESYGPLQGNPTQSNPSAIDKEMMDRLKALGYI